MSDWFEFEDIDRFNELCLAAVLVKNNEIVSISAVDCFVDNKIEIGVKTIKGHKRKGYGKAVVSALVDESFKNGIEEIGWHCVSTNSGSKKIEERCGFKYTLTYETYFPYPPIENIDNLSTTKWSDLARFFEKKANDNANHFWQASKCWQKRKIYQTL